MPSVVVASLATVVVTWILLRAVAHFTQDAREPPPIFGTLPFISPLIGMAREKADYYVRMRDKHGLPIYTLRALGPRLYVVNSLSLVLKIDRHINTVAFAPIELRAVETAMGVSREGLEKMGGEHRLTDKGYMMSFPRKVAPAASPGPGLDALNRTAINTISASFDRMASQGPTVVDLYAWTRRQIFSATMEATYGPYNPFRKPENEKAWDTFEPAIMTFLIDFFPNVFAKDAVKARDTMASEFLAYFQAGRHLEGSLLVQLREKHNASYGLEITDTARTEIGQVAASISNTAPSAFWAVWQMLADPVVFADCRREVEQLVHKGADGVNTIDLAQVRTACPVLVSTWQEVLRFHGISISARVIQEDTIIDGKYLLKKGGMVMMPTAIIHHDESLWGSKVGEFDHKRFLKSNRDRHRAPAAAFRGFGGGAVLCPGRHFVSTEVLAFAALLLVRFDARPIAGRWFQPRKDSIMNAAAPTPKDTVEVEFVPRTDEKWRVLFSDNDKGIDLIAEDLKDA